MEGKDREQKQSPSMPGSFQSPAEHNKNTEKYRALKRKFRVLRDEYINLLGMYEAACNKVKILSNERLFLQTKVDTVLKAQKVEEEEKKQPMGHQIMPNPPLHVKHLGKHGPELPPLAGKREIDFSKHHP